MKRIPLRKALPWLIISALVILVVYRIKFTPVPVKAYTIATGEIRGEVMGTGTLEARVKTTISPRIQERLEEVLVDQGDVVTTGQLLARLDDATLKQDVAVASAGLEFARASVIRVKADAVRAAAVQEQARLDHQRIVGLSATKVVSRSDLDKAVEALQVSEAEMARANAAIVEAESQASTAEQTLLLKKEQLDYAQIRSSFNGLIARRDRDPGGIVVPGGSILLLIATNEIWVSAWVDETAMSGRAVGQPARVVFRSESGRNYTGEVARLGRETDRETREFIVDVRVKDLPANWTIGQRAEVFIETGHKSGVLVMPQSFVVWREGKAGVFMNDHGKARWHALKLGLRGSQNIEVIEGLSAGEQLVRPAEGQKEPLTNGQRIIAK